MQTIVGLNDAKAVKRYSTGLAVDAPRKAQWTSKWMGSGPVATRPIYKVNDLENQSGEQISFDISMQLNAQPIEGDDEAKGKGEKLFFYSQVVYIDQEREIVNVGGRMSRKRTIHDLRQIARARTSDLWGRVFDQVIFIYLTGYRGVNTEFVFPTSWTGRANNSITTPDSNHIVYGGVATSKSTLQATDTMSTLPIDKAVAKAKMMGGGGAAATEIPQIQPITEEGEDVFLLVINPYQEFDMRRNTTSMDWADIQKAMAMSAGKNSPFMKGGLGMWNKVVIQVHPSCIRFNDYGSGAVEAVAGLFCGVQAGTIAMGQPGGGLSFGWYEEESDGGNQLDIYTNTMWGFTKTTFNGNDFGVIVMITAGTQP